MPPFRATPATTHPLRTLGFLPRPVIHHAPQPTAAVINQHHNFFLPASQQRFGSNFTSPSTPGRHAGKPRTSSVSTAMDEMIDADIDISDPPEAVGASNAATAKAARERSGVRGMDDIEDGNKMLYASVGALSLLGLYAAFKENPGIPPITSSSSSPHNSSSTDNPELDPGTDARGRTSPLSSVIKQSRQHHDLPAHAPGGETIEFKLGRG